ncbi:MAG: NAD-dependent protein deacylase [Lachnospiraceae bacterium]|nr:NAD-dependent protein deacylase [Oscillospiraceae bacterium]MDY5648010.1 NAD-dependent protein deacylase [Lachnospiraceae bacterium]
MNAESAEMLQKMIDDSSRIVFFGGAGVSTESGIPDFRSRGGLFSQKYKYPPRRILSKTFYRSKPEEFYRFYRDRMVWPDAKPNPAHRKLAELEAAGKLSAIVTQNIDGLHQAAGSRKVLEVHGSIHRNYCQKCGKFYDLDYMLHTEGVPVCGCGGVIKPDVVLYEEKLNQKVMAEAAEYLSKADMLIIGGTSLSVYPASRLIRNYKGIRRVIINRCTFGMESMAPLVLEENITDVLSRITVHPVSEPSKLPEAESTHPEYPKGSGSSGFAGCPAAG